MRRVFLLFLLCLFFSGVSVSQDKYKYNDGWRVSMLYQTGTQSRIAVAVPYVLEGGICVLWYCC